LRLNRFRVQSGALALVALTVMKKLIGFKNSEIVVEAAKRLDRIASQLYVQSKSFDEVYDLARNKSEMLASIPAIQPIKNLDIRRISSHFGVRLDPFYKVNKFHQGVDFSATSRN
jgi:murein DD-endopeptidase MepM/ murein hydrolase activator NlpD